jgi:hypothetical protein
VEADLPEHEGAVAGDVLQLGQVPPEVVPVLEEDVEREEVERVQLEVLGRRVVRVGHEELGSSSWATATRSRITELTRSAPSHRMTSAGTSLPTTSPTTSVLPGHAASGGAHGVAGGRRHLPLLAPGPADQVPQSS